MKDFLSVFLCIPNKNRHLFFPSFFFKAENLAENAALLLATSEESALELALHPFENTFFLEFDWLMFKIAFVTSSPEVGSVILMGGFLVGC